MKRLSLGSVLLLAAGVVMVVSLPLQWFTRTYPNGIVETRNGMDYAAYDVITTAAIGVLLVVAAFGVAAAARWGSRLGGTVALFACVWAALVIVAVLYPTDGFSAAHVSVGLGAYAVAAGAALALVGMVMSSRRRGNTVITSGVASSA